MLLMGENTLHVDGSIGDEEKTEQEVNDAVSAGIDAVLDGDEPPTGDGDESASVEGDEAAPAGEEGDAEGKPEGEGEGTGEEESGDGEGAESGEAGAGEEGLAAAPDYTVPEGLNEKSTERFSTLVNDNKELREQTESLTGVLTGMRQMVADSGLNDKEFLGAVDFAATIKRDPAKGIELMQNYMKTVAKQTGIEVPGMDIDVLEDFPDLKEQVEDMAITKTGALEIAKARRQAQQQEATNKSESETQAYKEATDAALKDMTGYLTGLSGKDIDWAAKSPLLIDAAAYARDNLHPQDWLPHMKKEYDRITQIAQTVGGKQRRTPTPLTDKSGARGGQKEPQTIAEAIDQIL